MSRTPRVVALVAVVFVAAVAAGWAFTSFVGPLIPALASPGARPTPHPYAPLTLLVTSNGGQRAVTIGTDTDCSALLPSQVLFDVCSLAVNADPAVIGGAAFGSLNAQDTPSYDALVWRARADRNPAICAAGGLESPRLQACQQASVDAGYVMSDIGVEVRIPLPTPAG